MDWLEPPGDCRHLRGRLTRRGSQAVEDTGCPRALPSSRPPQSTVRQVPQSHFSICREMKSDLSGWESGPKSGTESGPTPPGKRQPHPLHDQRHDSAELQLQSHPFSPAFMGGVGSSCAASSHPHCVQVSLPGRQGPFILWKPPQHLGHPRGCQELSSGHVDIEMGVRPPG